MKKNYDDRRFEVHIAMLRIVYRKIKIHLFAYKGITMDRIKNVGKQREDWQTEM